MLFGKYIGQHAALQGGGDMIDRVSFGTTYKGHPSGFEAIPADPRVWAIAAIDYLEAIGWDAMQQHESDIAAYAQSMKKLRA